MRIGSKDGFIVKIDLLNVVAAIKQMVFHPATAFGEQTATELLYLRIPHGLGHFLGGFKRCEIESCQIGVGAKELVVIGAVLPSFDDAVFVQVPPVQVAVGPGKGDHLLDGVPFRTQPLGLA